jgi:hypothetical protein
MYVFQNIYSFIQNLYKERGIRRDRCAYERVTEMLCDDSVSLPYGSVYNYGDGYHLHEDI